MSEERRTGGAQSPESRLLPLLGPGAGSSASVLPEQEGGAQGFRWGLPTHLRALAKAEPSGNIHRGLASHVSLCPPPPLRQSPCEPLLPTCCPHTSRTLSYGELAHQQNTRTHAVMARRHMSPNICDRWPPWHAAHTDCFQILYCVENLLGKIY